VLLPANPESSPFHAVQRYVLSTNSVWLLGSLVPGCNGLLSGRGSVIADLQAKPCRAVKANDLAEAARRLNDLIHPMIGVFYAEPFIDMHNRKEALALLGQLPRAVVRPPPVKITNAEIALIEERRWRRSCSAPE
jgi:4-hydroxy-tetrahydrodipicolinate synthase